MWNNIKNKEDIRELMECFGGFKGSCLCDMKYRSGAFVGTVSEHFINDELSLTLIFQRRSMGDVQTIELRFTGLRDLRLSPLGAGFECYLSSATLLMENDLLRFSTWEDLDTINADAGIVLISAKSLLWRDISDVIQYTA